MNVEVIIGVGQSEMAYQSIKDPKGVRIYDVSFYDTNLLIIG